MDLDIRLFTSADFAAYKAWMADEELRNTIGDVDDEWLAHVLSDEDGADYVAYMGGELVAVLGIVLPTTTDNYYVVSNIAVHPARRGQGIGRAVLARVMALSGKRGAAWVAYVSVGNKGGQAFFEQMGWAGEREEGWWRYRYRADHQ